MPRSLQAQIFLQTLAACVHRVCRIETYEAPVPGLINDLRDISFVCGIAHNKAVFVRVLGKPKERRSVGEALVEM